MSINKIGDIPRPEYPRPDFKRENWLNLNGEWDFAFDDNNEGEKQKWFRNKEFDKKIIVPFCFQSELSGIHNNDFHDYVWYKQSFELPKTFNDKRTILHFGAVDYFTKVWINGDMVGTHKGGHVSFEFDITDYLLDGKNEIVIKVEDIGIECRQPRGKQSWMKDNFGCWYHRTTGIWQTVWLEAVPNTYIKYIRMTPDIDKNELEIEAEIQGFKQGQWLQADITFKDISVVTIRQEFKRSKITFKVDIRTDSMEWKVFLWNPENPNLYDIEFMLLDEGQITDKVQSYFGMRKISMDGNKFLLNNSPYYQKLILDQGYFPDGLLTPPSEEAIIKDIEYTKAFGYNGARKHQKVEDPLYLYWCDKMGLLVWGEMASPYEYDNTMVESNTQEWLEVIKRDYNHPCIVVWTLMNESWGVQNIYTDIKQQQHTLSLYHMIKSVDSTRLAISNDGWEHTYSDILTIHDYVEGGEEFIKKYKDINSVVKGFPIWKSVYAQNYTYEGQPILLSEYGGIAFDTEETGWGYGNKVKDEDTFIKRFENITTAIKEAGYFCGFCYTQLTDVQQEINGLLTFDRKPKIDPQIIKKINDSMYYY